MREGRLYGRGTADTKHATDEPVPLEQLLDAAAAYAELFTTGPTWVDVRGRP